MVDFTVLFQTLVGVPLVIALLINVGKRFNVIKEGQSALYSQRMNAVFFAVILLLNQFDIVTDLAAVDSFLVGLSDLGLAVIGLFPITHGAAGLMHDKSKGTLSKA